MGFMDKLKGAADKVGNTLETGFKNVSDSSQKLADKMKLKKQIGQLESEINTAYLEIGKKFFEANSVSPSEEYAEKFTEITSKSSQIENLKNELNALEDKFNCPGCNAVLTKGQSFCDKCGINVSAFSNPAPAQPALSCPNCGAAATETQKFCEKCGTSLTQEKPAETETPASDAEHVEAEIVIEDKE